MGIVMTRSNGTTYKLYWAKSNLCTSGLCANPEDYGDYFAWGETNGKSLYDRRSYKWFSGPLNNTTVLKYNYMSSYGEVDNIHVLQRGEKAGETMDDAARAKLGGKWRMPTFIEWKTLVSECKWTWTENYNETGVKGFIVIAGNGNRIFLPAAGRRDGYNLKYAGFYGYYWSSSIRSFLSPGEPYSPQFSPTCAASINFSSSEVSLYNIIDRSFGFSVRPVYEGTAGSDSDGLLTKANTGDANAQFELGENYYKYQDYEEAVRWYRRAAEQGFAPAQENLGLCYERGQGVQKDYAEAVKWYRKAAEQGNAAAQNNYANCLYAGKGGVPQDYTEAAKWYQKAAEQGDEYGQFNLGACYFFGVGVLKDYAEAVKWYRKAAEQGNVYAQHNLGECYFSGEGVQKDYTEAVKWYRKAAEQGNASAQYRLGECYRNGRGVPRDITEAVKWYRKAAEQGNASAKAALKVL